MLELKNIKRHYKTGDFVQHALKGINLEILMICCGFNLHKYHLKSQSQKPAA